MLIKKRKYFAKEVINYFLSTSYYSRQISFRRQFDIRNFTLVKEKYKKNKTKMGKIEFKS